MLVKFKRLQTYAQLPNKATKGAACYDCVLPSTYEPLLPGQIRIIPLGFSVQIPDGYEIQIRSRSGLASRGIIVANSIGVIDPDFTGEVAVILMNLSQAIQPLNQGDRICQLMLNKTEDIEFEIVDEIDCTERGDGGFGSTGV